MYHFTTEANCIGIDTDMFFTLEGSGTFAEENLLKTTCNNCTVKAECLDYALHNAVLGWWGGTSESQRRKMRLKLNIVPVPIIDKEVA